MLQKGLLQEKCCPEECEKLQSRRREQGLRSSGNKVASASFLASTSKKCTKWKTHAQGLHSVQNRLSLRKPVLNHMGTGSETFALQTCRGVINYAFYGVFGLIETVQSIILAKASSQWRLCVTARFKNVFALVPLSGTVGCRSYGHSCWSWRNNRAAR